MAGYEPRQNQTMDSHSSFVNNKRLQMLFMQADSLGQAASNSLHYSAIQAYWNIIERIYTMNFRSILITEDDQAKHTGDKLVNEYYKKIEEIEEDPTKRTIKTLREILFVVKKLEMLVMMQIQLRFQYFFRFSSRQMKGLENVEMYDENIFSTKKGQKNEIKRIKGEDKKLLNEEKGSGSETKV